jgi:hypothetical protein
MKLVRATKTKFIFRLPRRESRSLREILTLYPRIPAAHQPLSKTGRIPDRDASQALLDEALREQRAENRRQMLSLLADPKRYQETATGGQLSLSRSDAEWLLQVLNDIRVGSWLLVGSPEGRFDGLNEETAPDFWAMEMAGCFQAQLLEALGGPA